MFNVFIVCALLFTLFYLVLSVASFFYKSEREKKFIANKAPLVTIHIPTYNELAALTCAQRCLDFDYPKDRYSIMIGDDSNDPQVSAKIDAFASKYPQITVTRRGNNAGFKPGNLNVMLKYTKTPYIVIFDSDFVPGKDFLKRIMTPFIYDSKLAGVQARWKVSNPNQNFTTVLGTSIINVFHHTVVPFMKKISGTVNFCGSAEAVRVDLLRAQGGWKHNALTEDIEYSMKMYRAKKKVLYLEDLTCECEVPYTLSDLCRQQMRWAHGNIAAYKEHLPDILTDRSLSFGTKLSAFMLTTGYVFTFLIVALTVTGVCSFITNAPGPINYYIFFTDFLKNIALSSGLMIAGSFSFIVSRLSKVNILKLLVVSFSSGLVVTYFVNKGVFSSLRNKPMQWFMLKKNGNAV